MTNIEAYDREDDRAEAVLKYAAQRSGIPWVPFTDVQKREAQASAAAMETLAAIDIYGVLNAEGAYSTMDAYDTHDQYNPDTGKRVLQGSLIVQMLAADRWKQYLAACTEDEETLVDNRDAPSYDEADPLTLTRLYVLTNHSKYRVALELPYDWNTYIHNALARVTKCDAHLLHRCYDHQAAPAEHTVVYKRGEIVYAFKICPECLDALSWVGFTHPDYAGPTHKWIDDGNRGPQTPYDPWRDSPRDSTTDADWEV